LIGKDCGSLRVQRAVGWCETARNPFEIALEQEAERFAE
jgi:hypothetical protein